MDVKKGKLIRWVDAKGFGFIKPDDYNSKEDVFIHISALKGMERKPVIGDIINYEISTDTEGRIRAINAKIEGVRQVLTLDPVKHKRKSETAYRTKPRTPRKAIKTKNRFRLLPAIIIGISVFIYSKASEEPLIITQAIQKIKPIREVEKFQCEGKVWCTEMNSYEEAVFYLRNCPGTKMDGDGDGIPCERQF